MSNGPDAHKSDTATPNQETAQTYNTSQPNTKAVSLATSRAKQDGIGESAGRALDSVRETLSQPEPKQQLIFGISLFAVIGGGFSLTGIFAVSLIMNNCSGLGSQLVPAMFVMPKLNVLFLIGSIIGAFIGVRIADRLDRSNQTVYLTSLSVS